MVKVQEYSPERIGEKHLNILIPFLPIRFRERMKEVLKKSGKDIDSGEETGKEKERKNEREAAREALLRELTEFLLRCTVILGNERKEGILSEHVWKDIGEFLWKACGYLLEEDAGLYEEVSVKVEPAIKLSREIIQELKDDIEVLQENNKELQGNNRELQENNKELHQELENAIRRLAEKAKSGGKSAKEIEEELMAVFALTEKEAEEKVKIYWKEE